MTKNSAAFNSILQEYERQIRWLFSLVTDPTGERIFEEKSLITRLREQREQLARMADFLDFAGNPQNHYPSIHVAGTSGKGSVVTMMAALLSASGYSTAHHTSPYLQICNEKLVIDGEMITPTDFTKAVRRLRDIHNLWLQAGREFSDLRYGEAWVALTYLWFAWQGVDWAVIETGLGGRYDPTNVLPARLAVITNVDFDHTDVIGPDLASIAHHKAGIIKPGGLAITSETKAEVLKIIRQEAEDKNVRLYQIGRDFDFTVHSSSGPKTIMSIETRYRRYSHIELNVPGTFQLKNVALSVAGLDMLAETDEIKLTDETVRNTLKRIKFPGRMETMQQKPLVILDGAHNPHKIQALVDSLRAAYPDRRITAVVGMMRSKDAGTSILALVPLAARFIVTAPHVFGKLAYQPDELQRVITAAAPQAEVHQAPTVEDAIKAALQLAATDEIILVTGSVYLAGAARDRWYSSAEMLKELEQQRVSSWS